MKIKQIYNDYKWAFRCFGFILILALLCLPLHWIEPYVKFQLTPLALE